MPDSSHEPATWLNFKWASWKPFHPHDRANVLSPMAAFALAPSGSIWRCVLEKILNSWLSLSVPLKFIEKKDKKLESVFGTVGCICTICTVCKNRTAFRTQQYRPWSFPPWTTDWQLCCNNVFVAKKAKQEWNGRT